MDGNVNKEEMWCYHCEHTWITKDYINLKDCPNCKVKPVLIYRLSSTASIYAQMEKNRQKEKDSSRTLKRDCYWNKKKTIWKQPPVRIKIGDLVDIEYGNLKILGRYVGKGKGAAIVFNPQETVFIGYVSSRGVDRNPKLVTDEKLLDILNDLTD